MKRLNGMVVVLVVCMFSLGSVPASAAPVDLSTWLIDGGGSWTLHTSAAPNDSARQNLNSPPTVLFNNLDSQGLALSGTIRVESANDDDFIGFVL